MFKLYISMMLYCILRNVSAKFSCIIACFNTGGKIGFDKFVWKVEKHKDGENPMVFTFSVKTPKELQSYGHFSWLLKEALFYFSNKWVSCQSYPSSLVSSSGFPYFPWSVPWPHLNCMRPCMPAIPKGFWRNGYPT